MHQRFCLWKPFGSERVKVLFQSVMNTTLLIFDFYFAKVPNLFFLVIHFVALCWIKMFSFSFFPSQLYFFFIRFLSRTWYCTVSTYFQISFNNLLPNKQTNKQMKTGGKNNSCIKRQLFCLSCDRKDCKHCTLLLSKYIKASWRRAEDSALSVIGLNGPCVVDKVECTKHSLVNCTHKI